MPLTGPDGWTAAFHRKFRCGIKSDMRDRLAILVMCFFLGVNAQKARADDVPCAVVKPIQFAPRASEAAIHGAIVRGEVACFSLGAKSGQKATITVTSIERNAVFQFYQPGWKVAKPDADHLIEGTAYPNAGEGEDATSWSGSLTGNGRHLLVLGTTRGGAAYELKVSIAP